MSISPKLNIALKSQSSAAPAQEREKELFWANIGTEVQYENSAGEMETQFISLNYGIPLSSVPAMKKGGNVHWNAICDAKDDMHAQLLEIAKNLAPGETCNIPITLQLRHVGESPTVKSDENPFMVKLKV